MKISFSMFFWAEYNHLAKKERGGGETLKGPNGIFLKIFTKLIDMLILFLN
jgi:hypothetical protein